MSVTLICLIIAITDGDTLKATCDNEQVVIRLAEIDAPEKKQEFYVESKKSLSDLCLDKKAKITTQTKDRYKRIIARINCDGVDASEEQVKRGMAWVYDRYATDHNLHMLQDHAHAKKIGLWQTQLPIEPWKWRKKINE